MNWDHPLLTAAISFLGGVLTAGVLFALLRASRCGRTLRRKIDAILAQGQATRIEEDEQRFRNLADRAPVLLIVTDSLGAPVFFNQTWAEFTGRPLASLSGRGWLELVHPDDLPACEGRQKAATARRRLFRHEFRLRHVSGGYRWMMAVFMPRWHGENFVGYIGSFADITAHRQLEQALRRQVEYEKMLAAISAKFVSVSPSALDDAVRSALGEIGRFTGADRAYIYLSTEDGREARLAYYWNIENLRPLNGEKPAIALIGESWLIREMKATGRLNIPNLDAVPAGEEREMLAAAGVRSLVAVPLASGDRMLGILGLHSVSQAKAWREEDIMLPKLVGEVILGAILRCQAQTALAVSEAENKAILASVPDILYHVRDDGTILDIKPSGRQAGLPAPAPVGSSIGRLLPAHLAKPAMDAIGQVLAVGRVQRFEYYLKTDNATAYYEARVTKAGARDVLVIVRDITERRRSEACDLLLLDIAVMVLEERPLEDILTFACEQIKAIFDVSLLWVGRKEPGGSVRLFAAGEEATECIRDGGVRWDDSPAGHGPTGTAIRTGKFQLAGIDDPRVRQWRARLAKHGAVSGASFPLKVSGLILGALTLFTADQGFWTKRTIVHLTNFAEQIALAIHATTSRQRLKLLTTGLESAVNAVIITDRTGSIQWVNPAFLGLTGLAAADVQGKNVRGIFAVPDAKTFYLDLWQHILAGRAWQGEITSRSKDGASYTAEMSVTPVRDESGELANFLTILHDVTRRRQAEQEMLEAREAVVRAERLSSLGIMAAGIAHEINQPLNSLKVTADGMLYWHNQGKTPALAKIMENIGKISKQADRIDNIIKHMRFFVRSSQRGEPEACDINTAVEEALSLIGSQLAAHAIAVRTRLAADLPTVAANNTQLEEVIINLLVNAMQSLDTVDKPDKLITIVTGWRKDEVFLEIGDNGPGIGNNIKGKVFEPFFTTKPAGEGMGLGLSIVHSIVASYGGQITIKGARRNRGAVFRITFPAGAGEGKGEEQA
ncbi:PAS domain S-box protein [Anaeroselena agilis]|uniref:histidine kinase n=1 Tax=Anaeroselena agilis TaxID=3063788 RepID=A0ABU3NZ53_9FIRM|nr:PAS domain S-box protein [Selenomonadales bacterium 4137-cl]